MPFRILLVVLICSGFIASCGNTGTEVNVTYEQIKDNKDLYLRKTFSSKGKLVLEEELLKNDTGYVRDGLTTEYYENGDFRNKVHFKKGRKQGVLKQYDSTGAMTVKFQYEEDYLWGGQYRYYSDGTPEMYGYIISPTHPSDTNLTPYFFISFNKYPLIDTVYGNLILQELVESEIQSKLKDSVKVRFAFIETPEYCNADVDIYVYEGNKKVFERRHNELTGLGFAGANMLQLPIMYTHTNTKIVAVYNLVDETSKTILIADTAVTNITSKQ